MRIYELANLTELKKDSAAIAAAKGIDFKTGHDYIDNKEVYSILKSRGWTAVGDGLYARVFTNPDYPYALKLFSKDDRCYVNFLKVAMNSNNPHFPKFRGKLVSLGPVNAVRMEKLEPLTRAEYTGNFPFLAFLEYYFGKDGPSMNIRNKLAGKYELETEEEIDQALGDVSMDFEDKNPQFVEAIEKLKSISTPNCMFDLHGANFMKRGSTFVITDPLAPAES